MQVVGLLRAGYHLAPRSLFSRNRVSDTWPVYEIRSQLRTYEDRNSHELS